MTTSFSLDRTMNRCPKLAVFALLGACLIPGLPVIAAPPTVKATIHAEPLHGGKISPMLFGNFMELLDDLAPGMWAEMLNDRSFEGVIKASNWSYFDGKPNFCDREWNHDESWTLESAHSFNGGHCAKLTAGPEAPASISQSGLAVKKAGRYVCTGYYYSDDAKLKVEVVLKARVPDGTWVTLASADLPPAPSDWKKFSVNMISDGDTDRTVFEVRAKGEGHLWLDKLSLMPGNNLRGWRKDVVVAIYDAQPAIIRWGGSTCDPGEYKWKKGIGDRDLRTPFHNKVWGRIDPNDVGIDEFCQFCELVNAEPLICLSFSDGPQSAADLVEYCNGGGETTWGAKRTANGHPAPYHVLRWQVGNEISGNDETYLKRFEEFVKLMKKADPAILLATSFPSQKLLDRVGRDIAYIGPHHYTPDFEGCDRDFVNLTRMIDTTPGCSGIKIAVTEWNVSGGDWGLQRGRQWTLGAALLNARYLHVLMRHSDKAEIACRSNLANSYCGAIIETDPAGVLKRPSYHIMRLYARHAKPIPLKMESPPNGPDLFACALEDKKSVTIFAINPGSEPVELSFDAKGFSPHVHAVAAECVRDVEDARQPDVINHWETPNRVTTTKLETSSSHVLLPAFSTTAIDCEGK